MKKNSKVSEWEYIGGDSVHAFRCRNCSCFTFEQTDACPKCKAKMNEKEKDNGTD